MAPINPILESPNEDRAGKETPNEGSSNDPIFPSRDHEYADPFPNEPLSIAWWGVVLAGGCFPILAGFLAFVFESLSYGAVSFDEIGYILGYACFAFFIGIFYTVLMSIPAFAVLMFIRFSTLRRITVRGECGIFGGLTGFLATSGGGIFFQSFHHFGPQDLAGFRYVFTFSGAAIFLGHLGALIAGLRKAKDGFPLHAPFLDRTKPITIKFLMALTIGFAVFAAVCKSFEPAGMVIFVSWAFYITIQSILLFLERFFLNFWATDSGDSQPTQ